jgi:hypothetical protein
VKDQRVGHTERTEVLAVLGNAYEAGVLPVGEYDSRVAAVGGATHASQLRLQVADLPPPYSWDAATTPQGPHPGGAHARSAFAASGSGRMALTLGIASVLFSVCGVGLVLGLLAVLAGRNGGRRADGSRISMALVGRVLGFIGMALSVAALAAAFLVWHGRTGP